MICMAAFPSSEIFTLVSLAVEVIHQLELLVNCSHCFALGCCVCLMSHNLVSPLRWIGTERQPQFFQLQTGDSVCSPGWL